MFMQNDWVSTEGFSGLETNSSSSAHWYAHNTHVHVVDGGSHVLGMFGMRASITATLAY